jgi:hypothetical protein
VHRPPTPSVQGLALAQLNASFRQPPQQARPDVEENAACDEHARLPSNHHAALAEQARRRAPHDALAGQPLSCYASDAPHVLIGDLAWQLQNMHQLSHYGVPLLVLQRLLQRYAVAVDRSVEQRFS